jgi:hypothetical protein
MQDSDEQNCDRGGHVNKCPQGRMPEYLVRVSQVPVDGYRRRVIGKQGLCMRDDYRIIIYVKYPRMWRELLGDLMNIATGRQPGSYIYKLLDTALAREKPYCSPEKISVLPCGNCRIGYRSKQLSRRPPIDLEIIFAAKQMILNACDIRDGCIDSADRIVVIGQ